jgi:hypothetical protein
MPAVAFHASQGRHHDTAKDNYVAHRGDADKRMGDPAGQLSGPLQAALQQTLYTSCGAGQKIFDLQARCVCSFPETFFAHRPLFAVLERRPPGLLC